MAINPLQLLKLKDRFHIFKEEHPKVVPFLKMLREKALEEGNVLEIRVKTKDGQEYTSNIRLTGNDIETITSLVKEKKQE